MPPRPSRPDRRRGGPDVNGSGNRRGQAAKSPIPQPTMASRTDPIVTRAAQRATVQRVAPIVTSNADTLRVILVIWFRKFI